MSPARIESQSRILGAQTPEMMIFAVVKTRSGRGRSVKIKD
jgi:hypothetical protein